MLRAVVAIKHFRSYLLGKRFTLRTDHYAKFLQSMREPSGQTARWLVTLLAFDFAAVHRPGSQNSNADALSRNPVCAILLAGYDDVTEYTLGDIRSCNAETRQRTLSSSQMGHRRCPSVWRRNEWLLTRVSLVMGQVPVTENRKWRSIHAAPVTRQNVA